LPDPLSLLGGKVLVLKLRLLFPDRFALNEPAIILGSILKQNAK
jgi:hypothetical protein